jgi:hypothetical protein
MNSTKLASIGLAAALAAVLQAAPAQALVARTFLSAAGSDSNNCANVLTPCRHLAAAYAATAPNGEIYVLDPANYGSVTITGPVSIEGHGWASIAPVSGSAAITINANTGDKINVIGVVLDGTNLATTTGIQFNSGGTLIVRDSVIRNFTQNGINFTPAAASKLLVGNTLVSDNGGNGIAISANLVAVIAVISRVDLENNVSSGLNVGANQGGAANVTIGDSVSATNATGITASNGSGGSIVVVRNSTIAGNAGDGLVATNTGATIRITRSTVTGNGTGWTNSLGGVVTSYADNNIDSNGSANTEPPSPLTYH